MNKVHWELTFSRGVNYHLPLAVKYFLALATCRTMAVGSQLQRARLFLWLSRVYLSASSALQVPLCNIKTWAEKRAILPAEAGRYNCAENHSKSAPKGFQGMGDASPSPTQMQRWAWRMQNPFCCSRTKTHYSYPTFKYTPVHTHKGNTCFVSVHRSTLIKRGPMKM